MGTLQGKVAIVTGAARGIGRAIALHFLRAGAMVVPVDILPQQDYELAEVAAGKVLALQADVADEAQVAAVTDEAVRRFGGVDILVNNAGISPKHNGRKLPVEDTPLEEWLRVLDVNLTGTFLFSRAVVPHMKKRRWGRIINIASQAGRTASTIAGAHYSASKAGIIGFSRALAMEVGAKASIYCKFVSS